MSKELICPICLTAPTAPLRIEGDRCGSDFGTALGGCPGRLLGAQELSKARFVNKMSKQRKWIVYGRS